MSPKNENEIENVRVFVRIRPSINPKELCTKSPKTTVVDPATNLITLHAHEGHRKTAKTFKFDFVFTEELTQVSLYQRVAQPIVEQVFKGYNGTIFAYGQTGSGKTYTMLGDTSENKGIIPNTFAHIFSRIGRADGEKSFVVTVTYLEIYNEEVRDLLSPNPHRRLELRERFDVGVYVKGLTGFTVDSVEAINDLMLLGNANRMTRATLMNNVSSRSHAVFTITIEAKDSSSNQTTSGKLNLVDLAGSERIRKSNTSGEGLREASHINQSLFVLSNVISALVEEKTTHVPYRNSKLTRLLQNSFGGNSKTAMIATISSSTSDYDESLCTLRYASRAKLIKNHIKLNLQTDKGLIENFQKQIIDLQKQLNQIDEGKPKAFDKEFQDIEALKSKLSSKIAAIQNKILIGGQTIFDKAVEQQLLLESSFEELECLDRSRKELDGMLQHKYKERGDLQDDFGNLKKSADELDIKIRETNESINYTVAYSEEKQQDNNMELNILMDHHTMLTKEVQCFNRLLASAIPQKQLQKIYSKMVWNDMLCDFQILGIAHLGNHISLRNKRRFRKHFHQAALMSQLLNQRKNSMPTIKNRVIQAQIKTEYQKYTNHYDKLSDDYFNLLNVNEDEMCLY